MTEGASSLRVDDVFGDTCVLFDYSVERRADARRLFEERVHVEKVVSPRVKREFESVASRQQDIHRELLDHATSNRLEEYEPETLGGQKNATRYAIELYSELLDLGDEVEVVRRLNELVNQLEKARDELFGTEGLVTVVKVDGVDARLSGLLSSVVSNDADVRVLSDAVAWRRDGGSGTFLSEDADDILGDEDSQSEKVSDHVETSNEETEGGLSDSFEDFFAEEEKSVPEQINEQIARRYDSESTLTILSIGGYLERATRLES